VTSGIVTAFTLGFLYFVSAIPAGVAAHAPVWAAAAAAWCGYSAGGTVILLAGVPLREWLLRKLKINHLPDPAKFFWRIWHRFGLWGLALIAPITIGPQATAALALALGESPGRIQLAICAGILPWALLFGTLTALGLHGLHGK
jgi:hypothetical protein